MEEMDPLTVRVTGDVAQFEQSMSRAAQSAEQFSNRVQKSNREMVSQLRENRREIDAMVESMRRMNLGAFGRAQEDALNKASQGWSMLTGKLNAYAAGLGALGAANLGSSYLKGAQDAEMERLRMRLSQGSRAVSGLIASDQFRVNEVRENTSYFKDTDRKIELEKELARLRTNAAAQEKLAQNREAAASSMVADENEQFVRGLPVIGGFADATYAERDAIRKQTNQAAEEARTRAEATKALITGLANEVADLEEGGDSANKAFGEFMNTMDRLYNASGRGRGGIRLAALELRNLTEEQRRQAEEREEFVRMSIEADRLREQDEDSRRESRDRLKADITQNDPVARYHRDVKALEEAFEGTTGQQDLFAQGLKQIEDRFIAATTEAVHFRQAVHSVDAAIAGSAQGQARVDTYLSSLRVGSGGAGDLTQKTTGVAANDAETKKLLMTIAENTGRTAKETKGGLVIKPANVRGAGG